MTCLTCGGAAGQPVMVHTEGRRLAGNHSDGWRGPGQSNAWGRPHAVGQDGDIGELVSGDDPRPDRGTRRPRCPQPWGGDALLGILLVEGDQHRRG
jgi:hypothetical protein